MLDTIRPKENTLPLFAPPQSTQESTQGFIQESLKKRSMKIAMIGFAAILGGSFAGIYCANKYLVHSGANDLATLFAKEGVHLGVSHLGIIARAVVAATPFAKQQANTGTLYTSVENTFFIDSSNGFIQQKITKGPNTQGPNTQGPSWLTAQLGPIVSSYNTTGEATGVHIVGNIAYIADGTKGIQILNITKLNAPALIGSYDTPGTANQVQVVGNLAYVADGSGGLQIINILNPKNPFLIGSYKTLANNVQIVGSQAFVSNTSHLQILNIATPSTPSFLGAYKLQGLLITFSEFQVVGSIAYLVSQSLFGGGGLQIVNVTNPSAPTLIGSLAVYYKSIYILGNTAFLAGYNSLQLCNIATPSSPQLLGLYKLPGSLSKVHVVGNTAFVAAANPINALYAIDVTNQNAPSLLGSYPLAGDSTTGTPVGLRIVGDTAFVMEQTLGVQILSQLNRLYFTGTPSFSDQGDFNVVVTGTTLAGVASSSFLLRVGQPPLPLLAIPKLSIKLNQFLNYTFDSTLFFDIDDQTRLVYSVTTQGGLTLPLWLNFNPLTKILSGTPNASNIATLSLFYQASDPYFPPSRIPFILKVEAPPSVKIPLKDVTHIRNTLLNVYVPQDTFIDPNGDPLNYLAKMNGTYSLPSWLSFSQIGLFTGMPTVLKKFNLTVFANDGNGGQAFDFFSLLIVDPLPPLSGISGKLINYHVPPNAFANAGNITQYAASLAGGLPLPNWIQFDTASLNFTVSPFKGVAALVDLQVAATNTLGEVFTQVFQMNIALNSPPVYQNPISTQQAPIGKEFYYVMPDTAFFDPNGDVISYTATRSSQLGLPKWMKFDPKARTFSGTPKPDDTNNFAERIEVIEIAASDGQQTSIGTFNVAVTGESYVVKALKVVLPILSSISTLFGLYRKRAWILNYLHKKKYTKLDITLLVGQDFVHQFSCDPRGIQEVAISVLSQKGAKTILYKKMDGSRCICKKHLKAWNKIPNMMTFWLHCDPIAGTLYSEGGVPDLNSIGPLRIQAIGKANIILEQFDLQILENRVSSISQAVFEENQGTAPPHEDQSDMIPLVIMNSPSEGMATC